MTGIGYRKDFAVDFLQNNILQPDFIEVAPENWIGVGGFWKKQFLAAIGSPDELDFTFLKKIKSFLTETKAVLYSEHLSYTKCDNAHLYDLLPIPFTEDAVKHVAGRIRTVQEFLERRIAIEIISYYTPVAPSISESAFINHILEEADCDLLLDVNNVYVNAFNHHYDARQFIDTLPMHRVRYIHMAGHEQVSDSLIIDTHGEAIIDPVYALFEYTMKQLNRDVPVLLERDFNIPEMGEMQKELDTLRSIKKNALKIYHYATC
jgi:uncharacterized protein